MKKVKKLTLTVNHFFCGARAHDIASIGFSETNYVSNCFRPLYLEPNMFAPV